MTQAIIPDEVVSLKAKTIPSGVIEAFNEMIARNYLDGYARVNKEDVVELLEEKGFTKDTLYKKGYLDVEDIYRQAGWDVSYFRPGYNEYGVSYYTFTKKED